MTPQQQATALLIAKVVCRHYNMSFTQLCKRANNRKISGPRQLAHALIHHYFLFEDDALSYRDIGYLVGRMQTSSVMHSVRTVQKEIETNKARKELFDELLAQIYKSTTEVQSAVKTQYIVSNSSNRDWIEDFPDENGNYINKCCKCTEYFFGHKRRVICKVCYNEIIQTEK